VEREGISTISISLVRKITEAVKPPRALFLRWPFGHPLGEPFQVNQQMTILKEMLDALQTLETPGTIRDLPYRWRRETYQNPFSSPPVSK
jgi:D-proline reductase (dithiol) PrdB